MQFTSDRASQEAETEGQEAEVCRSVEACSLPGSGPAAVCGLPRLTQSPPRVGASLPVLQMRNEGSLCSWPLCSVVF